MLSQDYKVKVNDKEFIKIQILAFKHGYKWEFADKKLIAVIEESKNNYLSLRNTGYIKYGSDKEFFVKDRGIEVSAKDIIKLLTPVNCGTNPLNHSIC